ncbi:MAG: hypothetical protein Q8K11_08795 [Phenylobacterium sp.]|uniref:hypothetical protein n=1 Tax=Phenylobacterium sp. TaxID=1871053 RepID=UPI0027301F47|nr:hypothetical protein [Phenylobacterium sp.]MDP2010260.1 hypothetical protein [Phenylobacterium sp.]
MPATTFPTTLNRHRTLGALATGLIASAAALGFAPAAQAQGQDLSTVTVTRAPTREAISIRGKAKVAVRHEVRLAAGRVCRNAFLNRELDAYDVNWCSRASADKAMTRYKAIVRHNRRAGGEYADLSMRIVLSAK